MARTADTTDEGLERLRAVVSANPRSTAFVAFAHRLCDAGRAAEAEEVCRQGLAQHPRLATGQVALGRALLERARLREAQDVLIESVKANPEHGDGFRVLGEVVLRKGDLVRARAILEHAEELMPHDGRVADLLVQAGGAPAARAPRPKSDFEHTRVANARALADHMHEAPADPNNAKTPGPMLIAPDAGPADDATTVSNTASAHAWFAAGPATPPPTIRPVPPAAALPPRLPIAPTPGPVPLHGLPRAAVSGGLAGLVPDAQAVPVGGLRPPVVAGFLLVVALATTGAVYFARRAPQGLGQVDLRAQMMRALAKGSFRQLLLAKELGTRIVAAAPDDADTEAALALTNAFLAVDYGMPTEAAAGTSAGHAETGRNAPAERTASLAATRALLALYAGDLRAAREHAARGVASSPDSVVALVASERVKNLVGDLGGARIDLERAIARDPDFGTAVLDWAILWMEMGDATTAAGSLRGIIGNSRDHARAHLLLAEAERAAGVGGARSFAEPCRDEGKESRNLQAACALGAAADARMTGDRVLALKQTKVAIAAAPTDPRLLAVAAQQLALLGEIDLAAGAVEKARRLSGPAYAPVVWAEAAIRLGRGKKVTVVAALQTAVSPETRLVAARMAYAAGGLSSLAVALRGFGAGPVAADADLKDFSVLARERPLPSERASLETRAATGHPMAAYVLGRIAQRAGDLKAVGQMMDGALSGHGDACVAAGLLLGAPTTVHRSAATQRALRALKARNAGCEALGGPPKVRPDEP